MVWLLLSAVVLMSCVSGPILGSFGFFIIIARPLHSLLKSSIDFLGFTVAANDESWLWSMYEPGPGKSDVETPK